MNKITVYSTFDNNFGTWNIMDMDNHCLFYGNVNELDEWLDEHQDKYKEELH